MKALRILAFAAAAVVLGDVLARCIDALPVESPVLTGVAQWMVRLVDAGDAHDPDVVAFVAGVVLLALSILLAGVFLYAAAKAVGARRKRRASPHP